MFFNGISRNNLPPSDATEALVVSGHMRRYAAPFTHSPIHLFTIISSFCRFWLPFLVAACGCRFWLPFGRPFWRRAKILPRYNE
jgi:hypothetical protein